MDIRDKKGAENVVADHLSRLQENGEVLEEIPIEDTLRDDILYSVQEKKLPWYADIVNFLACGALPPDLSSNQKKKIKRESRHYVWDEPVLYKRGLDGLMRRCVPEEEIGRAHV